MVKILGKSFDLFNCSILGCFSYFAFHNILYVRSRTKYLFLMFSTFLCNFSFGIIIKNVYVRKATFFS